MIRKLNRVELINIKYNTHYLAQDKRDIFQKKFSFAYRPPVRDENGDIQKLKSDKVETYFYFSSFDHKDIKSECPVDKDVSRIHIIFGMHKFEIVEKLSKNQVLFADGGQSDREI